MQLTKEQQTLIEAHLELPYILAQYRIKSCSSIYTEYEDLCQVGNLALCNAALHYQPNSAASFKTYASCAIKNRMTDYMHDLNKRNLTEYSSLSSSDPDETYEYPLPDPSSLYSYKEKEIILLLNTVKEDYKGITKKGIEALLLKILGYDLQAIAQIFHVTPNHISAWLSRGKKALRTNPHIINLYS